MSIEIEDEIFYGKFKSQDDPQLLGYLRNKVLIPPPPSLLANKRLRVVLSKKNPHKDPIEQEEIYRFVFKLLGGKVCFFASNMV